MLISPITTPKRWHIKNPLTGRGFRCEDDARSPLLCHRQDAHKLPIVARRRVGDQPVDRGIQRVVFSRAHIFPRMDARPALPHENIPGFDELPAKALHTAPLVAGAHVAVEILRQARDRKILVYKKKRRKGYEKKVGHRQPFTELMITKINA